MEIKQYAHGEGDFWCKMGPFFASRQVRNELGIAMSSDESYTWFVAFNGDEVVGFAAVEITGGTAVLRHAYVNPANRANGIYAKMLEARMVSGKGRASLIKVTANVDSIEHLRGHGFTAVSTRGQYTNMEWHK